MSKDVIELNGKRYDAVTGALLGSGATMPAKVAARRAAGFRQGRTLDGIVGGKAAAHKVHATHSHPPKPVALKKKPNAKRQASPTLAAHRPERPKTLMRHVVKKPAIPAKPAIKTQMPVEIMAKPASAIVPKTSINQVNQDRLTRAKHIAQSKLINRFDVVPAPTTKPAHRNQPQHHPINRPAHYNAVPAHVAAQHAKAPAVHNNPQPKTAQTHADIFEAALTHAVSHQQSTPKPHRKHRRVAHFTAAIAAFLVIGGFVTYLNVHNIEIRVASVRAGFSAQLPGYKPVGYALNGPIKSETGRVSFRFSSGERYFTVTQQSSDWNSQTLLDNTVALSSGSHQTVQSKGRTIYLYDNHHATWVNGGVRYDITGNAALNPNDIASIAGSM